MLTGFEGHVSTVPLFIKEGRVGEISDYIHVYMYTLASGAKKLLAFNGQSFIISKLYFIKSFIIRLNRFVNVWKQ